jgi:DNA-binding NarL/FixJ family response regulator
MNLVNLAIIKLKKLKKHTLLELHRILWPHSTVSVNKPLNQSYKESPTCAHSPTTNKTKTIMKNQIQKPNGWSRTTAAERQQIINLRKEGYSVKQICEMTGRSSMTVKKLIYNW